MIASLRVRLCLVVLLALAPAIGLIVYDAIEIRRAEVETLAQEAERLNQVTATLMAQVVESARLLLLSLSGSPAIQGADAAACNGRLAELRGRLGAYSNIGVARRDGEIVCSAVPLPKSVNVAGSPWFERAMASRAFAVGDYQIGPLGGTPMLVFGHVLPDPRAEPSAMLFVTLELAVLSHIVAGVDLPPDAVLAVSDAAGQILALRPDGERWIGQSLPADLLRSIAGQRSGLAEGRSLDGLTRLWAFRTLTVPGTSFLLNVGVPRSAAYARAGPHVQRTIAGLVVVAFAALAAIWLAGGALVVRPARAIIAAARRLAAGDLSTRVTPAGRGGELGQIAQSFDGMAAALEERVTLTERGRRELELLGEVVGWLNATLDLPTVLGTVTEAARELTGADGAIIGLPEEGSESGTMIVRHSSGLRRERTRALRVEPGQGIGGLVMASRRPFRTAEYLADARIGPELVAVVRAEGIVAMLMVPVMSGERLEGLLAAFNRSSRPFSDEDEAVLLRLAAYAALAINNARHYAAARSGRERLQGLSQRLLEVQEIERRTLARDLHDDTGQALTALKLNLRSLAMRISGEDGETLAESLLLVDRVLEHVRDLSVSLRPSVLDDLGLAAALRWYTDRQAQRAGLTAVIEADVGDDRLAAEVETAAFRVAQEAITNVIRHAAARALSVEVKQQAGALTLTVADDGVGFDLAAARKQVAAGSSLGLLSMEERIGLAGGTLEIESAPGHGTEVRARFPLGPLPGP